MIIATPPVLKCKKCFTINKPTIDEFGEPEIDTNERNMGYENETTWYFEGNCTKCDNVLEVTISGWEYPIGIFNYEEFSLVGCSMTEKPVLEVEFDEEMFNDSGDEE